MDSVIVVELEIVTAVHNKKAVIGALNKQAHSAVDICVVILEAVENCFAVAVAHRLAVVGNRVLPPERANSAGFMELIRETPGFFKDSLYFSMIARPCALFSARDFNGVRRKLIRYFGK